MIDKTATFRTNTRKLISLALGFSSQRLYLIAIYRLRKLGKFTDVEPR